MNELPPPKHPQDRQAKEWRIYVAVFVAAGVVLWLLERMTVSACAIGVQSSPGRTW